MRRSIWAALAVGAALSAGAAASFAADRKISGSFLMGTGSATGNYYSFGSVLAQVINSHTGANITVSSTGGSVENVRLLKKGENEMALVQTDVNSYALNGVEQFASGAVTNFSAVTACYPEMVQIVASKSSGIKSVADMRGKRICVGAVGSGYEVAARQILGIYGMNYDDIDERFLSQSEGKNALQDDQIDAFFMCSGYPNANVTELSLMGKIEVISIDGEHLKLLQEKYPFYAPFTTPDDQYNLGHPVTSVAVMSMLVVLNEIGDDDVYAMTAAIYDHLDEIRALNKKGEYMSLEGAFRGIPGNIHPGAARFYEEKGLKVPGR
ncbi:TAXI family TRAP transporter solute-binding subunit [Pyramidobacter sp. SM-530-WT-4B]|uniref:TAXI family TRAP transporter solute-binding subunit n=1 Tax=Pyramidobacter porci TaxID=2605789 RepID=A0A6L5YAH2_9BACT|nr:TAXI family TRAP transporter solute-binding subunit [Pyramidobacter porci]MDY2648673.1 TAXI family TRAP transporter solute-binding subunit [Pyramidobacter porci]MST55125.1 TAXI family TRAP transporter solute-binding subunit [Pyramidobacter porci]